MIRFLNIEKGGERPRKDISKYSDVKEEFSYALDDMFEKEEYSKLESDKVYDLDLIKEYIKVLDLNNTNEEWFANIKEFAVAHGYAGNTKDYKKNPENFKGHVGDVCEVLRVVITGRTKSPDLFSIMKILGKEKIEKRIKLYEEHITK